MKANKMAAIFLAMAATIWSGCGSNNTAPLQKEPTAQIQISVDESVTPSVDELPMLPDGSCRPLSAVADDDGGITNFVANELLITYSNKKELDDFIERYSGELLLEINPAQDGLDGMDPMALVRVDSSALQVGKPAADLADILNDRQMYGTAKLRFSSDAALRLVATACAERRDGMDVSINFVGQSLSIPQFTEEVPDAGGYINAYDWSYWNTSGMDIGVPEAWSLLYYAGKLDARVKIAILDGGFSANDDFPQFQSTTVWGGASMDRPNSNTCTGGFACPWHGTEVTSAAMALPDNRFGSAGTAGPVAEGLFVYTPIDAVSASAAMIKAHVRHAHIINASFGGNVHWALAHFLDFFKATTSYLANHGTLVFASAGNDGRDVDLKTCVGNWCWEKRFFFPCENPGVICVGGLKGTGALDPESNRGSNSVDMYAPYCMNVGPTPDNDGNIIQWACGTSFSSPFVAGVAALVWAASDSLSSDQVKSIIEQTATVNLDRHRVNAYKAVLSAMGTAFDSRITGVVDGTQVFAGIPLTLMAQLNLISSPSNRPVSVELHWNSSVDGDLGTDTVSIDLTNPDGYNSAQSSLTFLPSPGHQVITLTSIATINAIPGNDIILTDQESVSIEVANPAPDVEIISPASASSFCEGQDIGFRGQASDSNETLEDADFAWIATSGVPPAIRFRDLGTGKTLSVADLSHGHWKVTLSVSDSFGATGKAAVEFDVLQSNSSECQDLPPSAIIQSPANDTLVPTSGSDNIGPYYEFDFSGVASDPEDDDSGLLVEWFSSTDGKLGEGRQLTSYVHMTRQHSQDITITLRVTDSSGNVSEDSIVVTLYIIG